MTGYLDSAASDLLIGDNVIEPTTGALCRIESIEPVNEKGLMTLHMRGSSSLSYMGIVCKPERVLRRGPRERDPIDVVPVSSASASDIVTRPAANPNVWSESCACGMKSRAACATMCLKG